MRGVESMQRSVPDVEDEDTPDEIRTQGAKSAKVSGSWLKV